MDTLEYAGGGAAAAAANVVVADQSTDFAPSGTISAFTQLGTIAPSITLKAGSRLKVIISGEISTSDAAGLDELRINVDSGGTTKSLGRFVGSSVGMNVSATAVITGLSAGAHTVKAEFKKAGGAGSLFLRAATQPQLERFSIILEEIA